MTSIDSLPPELLLQVFHWATYDPALLHDLPSWKNYRSSGHDAENPWPTPSEYAKSTARALASTCTRWSALATEFELRDIVVDGMRRLRYYLDRIKKVVGTGKVGDRRVECPIRRITLALIKELVRTEGDTQMVVSLLHGCPNLEVLINEIYAGEEKQASGPVLLKSLVNSCPKLKRVHWRTMGCMQLQPSEWTSILASSSLATSLEALEVDSPSALPAHGSRPASAPVLELPVLRSLRLSVSEDHEPLISEIVDGWQLPSLMSLYLKTSRPPTVRGVHSLISTHGQSLATLAIDRSTSGDITLPGLPAAPIQELVCYGYHLEKHLSVPFRSISTLVARFNLTTSRCVTSNIFEALEALHRLPRDDLPELKDVVVLGRPLDTLQEPHPIESESLSENQRLWAARWLKDTPRLVNRNGVRLFTLVTADGGQI